MIYLRNISVFALVLLLVGSCSARDATETEAEAREAAGQTLSEQELAQLETAYFASGCFWCTEAVFERVKGVKEVVSGYAGGTKPNPTYQEVSAGRTDYAEAVRVRYDPEVVSYRQLVEVFFGSHDPTQLNRQGPDVGKQYRSAIFYRNEEERSIALEVKNELEASDKFEEGAIVTKFTKYDRFYEAEDYHQDYYANHPENSYIQNVSRPKVEKFMKEFRALLKEEYQQ